jgi:hypothetical protein
MDLREMGLEGVDEVLLAQDRDQWWRVPWVPYEIIFGLTERLLASEEEFSVELARFPYFVRKCDLIAVVLMHVSVFPVVRTYSRIFMKLGIGSRPLEDTCLWFRT